MNTNSEEMSKKLDGIECRLRDGHPLHFILNVEKYGTLGAAALARHRDGLSEGTFKYAVIDARFEDKGRSLYEGAILYAGNHAAITEEILNETAPTYHALKPKGTDFSLLTIHRARRPTRNPRPGGN